MGMQIFTFLMVQLYVFPTAINIFYNIISMLCVYFILYTCIYQGPHENFSDKWSHKGKNLKQPWCSLCWKGGRLGKSPLLPVVFPTCYRSHVTFPSVLWWGPKPCQGLWGLPSCHTGFSSASTRALDLGALRTLKVIFSLATLCWGHTRLGWGYFLEVRVSSSPSRTSC